MGLECNDEFHSLKQRRWKANKVFGIGANKTGTLSLARALEILGLRTSHYVHHEEMSKKYIKNQFLFEFLKEFDAVTDLPIPSIYSELDRVYKGSKFILTIRDVHSWIRSEEIHHSKLIGPIFEVYLMYGSWYFEREIFIKRYQEHNRKVIEYFQDRKDDLLVMDICGGDGWEKLCPFLGAENPHVPFPNFNRANYR